MSTVLYDDSGLASVDRSPPFLFRSGHLSRTAKVATTFGPSRPASLADVAAALGLELELSQPKRSPATTAKAVAKIKKIKAARKKPAVKVRGKVPTKRRPATKVVRKPLRKSAIKPTRGNGNAASKCSRRDNRR